MPLDSVSRESVQGLPPRRFSSAQLVAFDVLVVLCLALIGQLPHGTSPRYGGPVGDAVEVAIWGLIAAGVLFRRRFPRATLTVVVVLGVAGLWMRSPAPISQYVALVLYSVVAASPRRPAAIAAAITGSLIALTSYCGSGEGFPLLSLNDGAIIFIGWLVGEYTRRTREHARDYAGMVAERAAAADAGRREQVVKAVAGERVKLARELHDVVAHAMSVIAVRAGVARMVIDTQPDQAREALGIIETTTRRTLQEMRLLVGVLRSAGAPQADLGPAPGLADLPALIADIEQTGVRVDLLVEGKARPLNPAVDLSAYRIVQEALTNVVRHAGPTDAHVVLSYRPDQLSIDVRDHGPDPDQPPRPDLARHGAGNGLIGIRERAALFDGKATAGRELDGYRVRVTLHTNDLATDAPVGEDSPTAGSVR